MKHRLHTWILNGTFYPFFILATPLLSMILTLCLAVQVPFLPHREVMRRFRLLIRLYGRVVHRLARPWVKIEYDEGPVPPPRACLFVCNYRSSSDPFLMACLPGEGIQWVKSWPFRLPILGLFARGSGYLSVYEMSKEELLAKSVKELRDGCSIIVFPEGTRSVSREMGSFHGLVFRLALQTGAPIVPVCLSGSEDKPRRGSLALHPGRIRVKVLPALKSSEYMEWSSFHLKQEVRERIRRELDRMEGVGA